MASTGSFTAMAIFWTTPDQSISLRARAVGIAVINATGNIGSAVSPVLIGWLKDQTGNFNSGLYFVAGLLVIGAVIFLMIPMKRHLQKPFSNGLRDPRRQECQRAGLYLMTR